MVLALLVFPNQLFAWTGFLPTSWEMHLNDIDAKKIAASANDLVVIDYSRDGTDENAFRADEIDAMKKNGKKVIAYLSIGKAEMWRFYWNGQWEAPQQDDCRQLTFDTLKRKWAWEMKCPNGNTGLVGEKNPNWNGATYAKYWEPDWLKKAIRPYLKRISEAHFDGVYLANIDAYEYWGGQNGAKAQYAREMEKLVGVIAALMKQKMGSEFLVIAEGGISIVKDSKNSAANRRYLASLDGIALRSLFTGNTKRQTQYQADLLKKYYFDKSPILLFEFVPTGQEKLLKATQADFEKTSGLRFIINNTAQDQSLNELSPRKI